MYRVFAADRSLIATVPTLVYVKFNRRNHMAVGCEGKEAEGITLNGGRDVYRFVDVKKDGIEEIPRCSVEYAEPDEELVKAQEEIAKLREENANLMAGLADIYERAEEQDEKQLYIMAALADIYENTSTDTESED